MDLNKSKYTYNILTLIYFYFKVYYLIIQKGIVLAKK